jgi:hypothetical protein
LLTSGGGGGVGGNTYSGAAFSLSADFLEDFDLEDLLKIWTCLIFSSILPSYKAGSRQIAIALRALLCPCL